MFDISFTAAFFGGILVFLSPCVLPIVPFFLSYMAGLSMGEIRADGTIARGARFRAISSAIMFSLGIITVFILLGATAFAVSRAFVQYMDVFRIASAIIVGIMGLHFLGVITLPFLNRSYQIQAGDTQNMSIWSAYIVGLAFAAGWTPCVGGVLTGVMFNASQQATAWEGLGQMVVFGLGMTLPFVLAAAFITPFMAVLPKLRGYMPFVEKLMGVLLLIFAILIATNNVNGIAAWMLDQFPDAWN